jgi:hypothetical protein
MPVAGGSGTGTFRLYTLSVRLNRMTKPPSFRPSMRCGTFASGRPL